MLPRIPSAYRRRSMLQGLTPAPAQSVPGGVRPLQQARTAAPQQLAPRPAMQAPQLVPAPKRVIKKKRSLEKVLADKVANSVPQSALLQQVSGLEKEVEGLRARRRAEVWKAAWREGEMLGSTFASHLYVLLA